MATGCGAHHPDSSSHQVNSVTVGDAQSPDDLANPSSAGAKQLVLTVRKQRTIGTYLVAGGRTLYMYPPDHRRAVTCTTDEECEQAWPPLFVRPGAQVRAGDGVRQKLIGSVPGDGGRVVTYNHWPLYSYVGDREPGQVKGQDQGSDWFVIAPDGTPTKTGPLLPG
jgi:predicted lipoprotein with Yx(FWY)xxD motif